MILLQQGSQKCSTHERLSKHRTNHTLKVIRDQVTFLQMIVFLQKNHLTLDKERKKGLMIHQHKYTGQNDICDILDDT